jgi:hypothetical protein
MNTDQVLFVCNWAFRGLGSILESVGALWRSRDSRKTWQLQRRRAARAWELKMFNTLSPKLWENVSGAWGLWQGGRVPQAKEVGDRT